MLAAGQLEQTRQFLDGSAGSIYRTGAVILRSRLELERGNLGRAIDLAQEASEQARGTDQAGLALLNLTAVLARHGFDDRSVELASQALGSTLSTAERQVAEATVVVSSTQDEGDLAAVADYLAGLALVQDAAGHARYAGITRLNLAGILLWQGRPREAGRVAARAEVDLGSSPSSPEWVAATVARAASLIQLGHVHELDRVAALIEQATTPIARDEAAVEAARLLGDYGSLESAESAASRVGVSALAAGYQGAWAVATATLALRHGDPAAAARRLAMANHTLLDAAGKFRIVLLEARILLANGSEEATGRIAELARIAAAQGSRLEELLVVLLGGFNGGKADSAIGQVLPEESHVLSLLAEEVCRSLPELGDDSRRRVWHEASLRPDRWVTALRLVYLSDPTAAELLCDLGTTDDAAALRSAASSRKWLRPLAARISRRLAPQVLLRDLGPVTITIGDQEHQRTLRRKVLGLLCYVATRPGMACTRDEALDAIWPDLGPDTAANSLHQTIYYLRRVFEPTYKEGMSAGYLEFDGDVLTLDRSLGGCREPTMLAACC